MARNRETVRLEESYSNERLILYQGDDSDNNEFEYHDEVKNYFDTEKGSQTSDVILKRVSDGKYFKFEKYEGSAGYREADYRGVEVHPEQVTTTKYV